MRTQDAGLAPPPMTVTLTYPMAIRLQFDGQRVQRAVGNRLARVIRKRLRGGMDGDGSALPMPRDGTPAKDSGRLIRDIRYDARAQKVAPTWRRNRSDVSKDVKTSFGLMRVLISTKKWDDPMGSNNPKQWDNVGEWTETAIAKEIDSGRGGLRAELRRIRKKVG